MSWIDTVVLTLILWSGVKGYLRGLRRAVLQLLCLLGAALTAGLYQQPLMVYLREEWHAEALLVAALGQKAQGVVAAMRPVAGIPAAPVPEDHLAAVVLSAAAALLFFLFAAAFFSLLLQISAGQGVVRELPEGQKMAGFFLGVLQGVILAFLLGSAMDVLLLVVTTSPLMQDLSVSYLRLLTERIQIALFFLLKVFA
ncbi:MAG: CvpA family protein [Firmicutes bacterium]|nr:CvpA family protein [Bacillota bacterium]